MWFQALWLACAAPTPSEPTSECAPEPLKSGQVRARRIQCSDEILPSGEARQGDWLLENAQVRLAFRDATVSLTQLQGTGGTLVDAALPEGADALVEAIPNVGGAWFDTAEVSAWAESDAAGLIVTGVLPNGEEATVTYTLPADSVSLELGGMDGLTIVPMTNSEVVGQAVETPTEDSWLLLSSDGQIEDLGGWVKWSNPNLLHVGARDDVHSALWPAAQALTATSDGTWVHIIKAGQLSGRLPVENGRINGWVPSKLDGLQAVAPGSEPGPLRSARLGQDLPVGAHGAVQLWVSDEDGQQLPATLSWNGVDYPWLPGDGRLEVGPGLGSGTVYAGPAYDTVIVPEQTISGTVSLEVQLKRHVGDALLAKTHVVGAPDPTERRSSNQILHAEAAQGVRWAVLSATDEIPRVSLSTSTATWISAQAGSTSGGPAGALMTWPWSTDNDAAAHGAAPWQDLKPLDLLDVMTKAGSRRAIIDNDWAAAAGKPVRWDASPEAFRLDSLDDLPGYLFLLNNWIPITPVGPWTWIEDITEAEASVTEAVRGVLAGRTTATTGPRLVLTVNGTGPGELLADNGFPTKKVHLRVEAAPGYAPTHAAILTDTGELDRWTVKGGRAKLLDVHTTVDSPNSVMAIAWTHGGDGPWAASAPIWVGRP